MLPTRRRLGSVDNAGGEGGDGLLVVEAPVVSEPEDGSSSSSLDDGDDDGNYEGEKEKDIFVDDDVDAADEAHPVTSSRASDEPLKKENEEEDPISDAGEHKGQHDFISSG